MRTLRPESLAEALSLSEIDQAVFDIREALKVARQSKQDSFGDMQANQNVKRQSIQELNSELQIYLSARLIKIGTDDNAADIISGDYNPHGIKV